MTYTHKLVDARDRIKVLAGKKRDDAERMHNQRQYPRGLGYTSEAIGLDIALRVIEDLLQD